MIDGHNMDIGNIDKCVIIWDFRRATETMEERDKLFVFPIVLIQRSQHCNRYKIGLQLSGRTHEAKARVHTETRANGKSIPIIRDILLIY